MAEQLIEVETTVTLAARRDRFAAAALTGLLMCPEHYTPQEAITHAREHADALIAELDKPKTD